MNRSTERKRPRNLAELILRQLPQGMPGIYDDDFDEIIRVLHAESVEFFRDEQNMPQFLAEAEAAERLDILLELLRRVGTEIEAELSPWHAREWFMTAYESEDD